MYHRLFYTKGRAFQAQPGFALNFFIDVVSTPSKYSQSTRSTGGPPLTEQTQHINPFQPSFIYQYYINISVYIASSYPRLTKVTAVNDPHVQRRAGLCPSYAARAFLPKSYMCAHTEALRPLKKYTRTNVHAQKLCALLAPRML